MCVTVAEYEGSSALLQTEMATLGLDYSYAEICQKHQIVFGLRKKGEAVVEKVISG